MPLINIIKAFEWNHLLLLVLWAIYFMVHSVMADNNVKRYFTLLLKSKYKYYRLCFNLISIILLIPIFWFSTNISAFYVLPQTKIWMAGGILVTLTGIALGKISFKSYSSTEFIGFPLQPDKTYESKLQTKGMLKNMRHPLYSATILVVFGFWIIFPTITNLVSVIAIIVYIFIGIILEERKLVMEFGQEYIDYRKKTAMLIPALKKKRSK
jgi:methanethiol S-methyltransferase